MNKILILFCVLGCLVVSCKNNDLSNSYWLAVNFQPIQTEDGYTYSDGMTLHFNNDKLEVGNVFDSGSFEYDLKTIEERIFVNDTLWAIKQATYRDSLILDLTKNNSRVKFIRLDKKNAIEARPELWKHKNWIISYNDLDRELFLTDSLFFDDSDSNVLIQKDLQTNQFQNSADKWKQASINGNQLFVISFNYWFEEFYRIKNYTGDSIIELESLQNPESKCTLRRKQYVSDSRRQDVYNQIKNQVWKMDEIISLDTISEGTGSGTFAKAMSLRYNDLSFVFNQDSTYHIYEFGSSFRYNDELELERFETDNKIADGAWVISETGNEIILDEGIFPKQFIDLIDVTSESITIGNSRRFDRLNESALDIQLYFKVKLINGG